MIDTIEFYNNDTHVPVKSAKANYYQSIQNYYKLDSWYFAVTKGINKAKVKVDTSPQAKIGNNMSGAESDRVEKFRMRSKRIKETQNASIRTENVGNVPNFNPIFDESPSKPNPVSPFADYDNPSARPESISNMSMEFDDIQSMAK